MHKTSSVHSTELQSLLGNISQKTRLLRIFLKLVNLVLQYEIFSQEFGWNKLIANQDKKSFRQCVSVQFNRKSTNNIIPRKENKDKKVNISRILLSIPPRPSKNILAKSKYYKKSQLISNFNKPSYAQVFKSNCRTHPTQSLQTKASSIQVVTRSLPLV